MPKMPSNIEPRKFHRGEYVGYGKSGWWRIKGETGFWDAYQQTGGRGYFRGATLAEIGKKIAKE